MLDEAQLTNQAVLLTAVARPTCHTQVLRCVATASRQWGHVVKRDLSPLQLDATEVTGSTVALDDRVAFNPADDGALLLGSASSCLFGSFACPRIPIAYIRTIRRRFGFHFHIRAVASVDARAVGDRVLQLVRRLTGLDFFGVGFLPAPGCFFVLFDVAPCPFFGSLALAWLAQIRQKSTVHEEAIQAIPSLARRALAQLFTGTYIEYVLLGLNLGILTRLVRVAQLVTSFAVRLQPAPSVFVRRTGEVLKSQPLITEAAMLQTPVVIDSWSSAHGSHFTVDWRCRDSR